MTTPSAVITALQDKLQASATLNYVDDKHIHLGLRERLVSDYEIVIEPVRNDENIECIGNKRDLIFVFDIIGYVKVRADKDKIITDGTIKGILDIENDIKKVISADLTLGVTGVFTRILESTFSIADDNIRAVSMQIETQFKQVLTTRT